MPPPLPARVDRPLAWLRWTAREVEQLPLPDRSRRLRGHAAPPCPVALAAQYLDGGEVIPVVYEDILQ